MKGRNFRKQAQQTTTRASAVPAPQSQQMALIMAPVGFVYNHTPPQASLMPPPMTLNGIGGAELFRAIDSLYHDTLKPYGRIVRKRLGEMARAAGHKPSDLGLKQLRGLCEFYPWLNVQSEDGGDWSALLRGREPSFVDVHSPDDVYPPALWELAQVYFAGMDGKAVLPGGRYACAQVLASRQVPFLRGRSLGQVCHIVQLAISEKKLLGYRSGSIVAYACSQSKAKAVCAERQRPFAAQAGDNCAVATWAIVSACLRVLIGTLPDGSNTIPLSNIKRLFRTRFQVDLSETALGYAKLSELLQDTRVSDLCSVQLQEQGYIVVPKSRPLDDGGGGTGGSSANPGSSGALARPGSPGGTCSGQPQGLQLLRHRVRVEPLILDDDEESSTGASLCASPPAVAGTMAPFLDTPMAWEVPEPGMTLQMFPPTPCPLSPYPDLLEAHSLPRLLGSVLNNRGARAQAMYPPGRHQELDHSKVPTDKGKAAVALYAGALLDAAASAGPAHGPAVVPAQVFVAVRSSEETSVFESWSIGDESVTPVQQTISRIPDHPLTPSKLETLGFRVHNTFINTNGPLLSPAGSSACGHSSLNGAGSVTGISAARGGGHHSTRRVRSLPRKWRL